MTEHPVPLDVPTAAASHASTGTAAFPSAPSATGAEMQEHNSLCCMAFPGIRAGFSPWGHRVLSHTHCLRGHWSWNHSRKAQIWMQDKRDVLSNLNTVGNGHGVLLEGITDYIKGTTANKNHMGNACVTWPEFSLVHHRCTYRIIVLSIQSLLFLICEPRWKKNHKLWMHQFFSSFKSAML